MCSQSSIDLGPTQALKQNWVSEMKLVHSWYCREAPNELPYTSPPTNVHELTPPMAQRRFAAYLDYPCLYIPSEEFFKGTFVYLPLAPLSSNSPPESPLRTFILVKSPTP